MSTDSTVDSCYLQDLPTIHRDEGELTVIEQDTRRVYFIYDIPYSAKRGMHAHKTLKQIMIAIHGSFCVRLDDGHRSVIYRLSDPSVGLYIHRGIWREFFNFTDDAVVLVLANERYDEDDYIRDYKEFLKYKCIYGNGIDC